MKDRNWALLAWTALILAGCIFLVGVVGVAYWFGTTRVVAEIPVAQVTEVPVIRETEQPVFISPPTAASIQSAPPAPELSCRLDKIGTWSETDSAQSYRIEVGGHGVQHMDFYPTKGVKAVSYIVAAITPSETPMIWWGYGSNWEGNPPGCEFDWVADAINYAKARLDSGHSGLVVDLRSGSPVVVANVANMSQEQIDALLATHRAAQK